MWDPEGVTLAVSRRYSSDERTLVSSITRSLRKRGMALGLLIRFCVLLHFVIYMMHSLCTTKIPDMFSLDGHQLEATRR